MKKLGLLAVGVVALGVAACEFHASTEPEPKTAQATPPPPPPPATPAGQPTHHMLGQTLHPSTVPSTAPTPKPSGPILGRGLPNRLHPRPAGAPTAAPATAAPGTTVAPPATTPTTPPPAGTDAPPAPVIHGQNALGSDQNVPGSWQGVVYFIPQDSQKLPDFTTLKPTATFYTKEINVAPRSFTDGFPGVDQRTEWFGVEYYNTLNVTKEDDYWFRIISDDGSKFYIDDTLIIDNDGVHPPTEKKGAAHLVAGNHAIRLDYFQGPRDQIAVQLWVTPPNVAEKTLTNTVP